jgi:protein O-mannosyl-transferase
VKLGDSAQMPDPATGSPRRGVPVFSEWAEAAPTKAALAIVLATLAIVVYVNALHSPFVYDDRTEVVQNLAIRRLPDVRAVIQASPARPVVMLSYAVNYSIGQLDPFTYHVTNLSLHVVNVLLLFWLVLGLRRSADDIDRQPTHGDTFAAFVAAALMAVHPLMTEAVGYVSGRSELLSGVFFFSALLCFRRAFIGRSRWYLPALTCFAIGLFTKETMAMLPVVLVAYDRLLIRPAPSVWRRRLWRLHIPLLVVVAVGAAVRVWVYTIIEHTTAAGIDWRNALVELHVIVRYLFLLIFPASQSIIQPVRPITSVADWRVLTSVAIIGALIAVAVRMRRRLPAASVGVVWFFVLLIPSASLILLASVGEPMSEHRAYLASAGFFMAIAVPVGRLIDAPGHGRRFTTMTVGVAVVLALLAAAAIARNRVWQTPLSLWTDAASKAPNTWMAVYGMADAHRTSGDYLNAVDAYRRAIALRPGEPEGYLALADSLLQLRRYESARQTLRAAVTRNPGEMRPLVALASVEERVFHNRLTALDLCRRAAAIDPANASARGCVERNERSTP